MPCRRGLAVIVGLPTGLPAVAPALGATALVDHLEALAQALAKCLAAGIDSSAAWHIDDLVVTVPGP